MAEEKPDTISAAQTLTWNAQNAVLFPGRELASVFANRSYLYVGINGIVRIAFQESLFGEAPVTRAAVSMPVADAYETAKALVQLIERTYPNIRQQAQSGIPNATPTG